MYIVHPFQEKGGRVIKMPRDCVRPSRHTAGIILDRNQFRISRPTELGSHARTNPGKLCKNKLHICRMQILAPTGKQLSPWRADIWRLLYYSHTEYCVILRQRKPKYNCLVLVIQHFLHTRHS